VPVVWQKQAAGPAPQELQELWVGGAGMDQQLWESSGSDVTMADVAALLSLKNPAALEAYMVRPPSLHAAQPAGCWTICVCVWCK
jgi:hypothetical protein